MGTWLNGLANTRRPEGPCGRSDDGRSHSNMRCQPVTQGPVDNSGEKLGRPNFDWRKNILVSRGDAAEARKSRHALAASVLLDACQIINV